MTTSEKFADLSTLSKTLKTSRLSFASQESLIELLGVTPGSVSPLALINDSKRHVSLLIDRALEPTQLFILHPLDNGRSILLSAETVKTFTKAMNHPTTWIKVSDRRNEAPPD